MDLAWLSGLRIWHYRELWCRSQIQLRSGVVVAVVYASSCSSDLIPSLETPICRKCSPKKIKEKKKKKPTKNKQTKKRVYGEQLFVATFSLQGVGAKMLGHQNKCTESAWWKHYSIMESGWQRRVETRFSEAVWTENEKNAKKKVRVLEGCICY